MTVAENLRVLGIVGSPRKGGNTEILVDEVLAGAEEAGASSTKVLLRDLTISPCKACDGCQRTGRCVQNDDMEILIELMEKADIWVFGSPVYWWSVTAQFKAFLDRWYGVEQSVFQGKKVILAIPMGGSNDHYARHAIGMLEDVFTYLGMRLIGSVIAPGMNGRGSVREWPQFMELARKTGNRVVGAH